MTHTSKIPSGPQACPREADLDLERLVWDQDYRLEIAQRLKREKPSQLPRAHPRKSRGC